MFFHSQYTATMTNISTFRNLIENYQIIIPRIQRDYAQGRLSEKATVIREKFVDTIVSILTNKDKKEKDLNFVYGSTNDGRFIPLDGQQRLTTLFLFHLYLDWVVDKDAKSEQLDYSFTYATRDSSTRFCEDLINYQEDLSLELRQQFTYYIKRKQAEKEKNKAKKKELLKDIPIPKTPSCIIRNQSWFFSQWDTDPTVAGMLVMLDEIHSRFLKDLNGESEDDLKAYFKRLTQARERLYEGRIQFQFQSLDNFTRTDDLYIKMNSRGLGLTDFEIFKSKLVEDFENQYPSNASAFKRNIDGKWCDFLWKLRYKVPGELAKHNVDIIYERLLKFLIPAEAATSGQDKDIRKYSDELFERNHKKMRFAHSAYLNYGILFSKDLLSRIFDEVDLISNPDTSPLTLNTLMPSDFSDFLLGGKEISYDEYILSYVWLRFSLLNKDTEELNKWMRMMRHLLDDSNVDSSAGLINALKGFNTLLNHYDQSKMEFYEWLANIKDSKIEGLSDYQLQEEVVKTQLRIRTSEPWSSVIEEAEEDPFMKGQIGFLLEAAGIAGLDQNNVFGLNEEALDANERCLFEKFESYKERAVAVFCNLQTENIVIKEHLLVRALLKYGDYFIKAGSKRNIANHPNDRDYSWHALLNVGKRYAESRSFFKNLLDDQHYRQEDVEGSLRHIASRDISNDDPWRGYLSGQYAHRILEQSNKGFLDFQEKEEAGEVYVRVLRTSQLNGFHDELYSLVVYYMLKEVSEVADKVDYVSVKSGSEDAGLVLRVNASGEDASVKITHRDSKWGFQYTDNWSGPRVTKEDWGIEELYDECLNLIISSES